MFVLIARTLTNRIGRFLTVNPGRLDGQSMVEYALLLMLMGTIVVVVLIVLGNQVHNVFHNVSCSLQALGGSCAAPPAPPLPPVED